MTELSRRDLIRLSAAGIIAIPVLVRANSAVALDRVRKPGNLKMLRRAVKGQLLTAKNKAFDAASDPFDIYANFGPPKAVLKAANASDVSQGISYARRAKLPLAVKSGGHNYAGYSTTSGILISVGSMDQIVVDAKAQKVTVGAGAHLVNVYNALSAQGQMIPAGTCPTVGVGGHVFGGGFGLSARKFGLLSDNLLSAKIVLASGRIVTASARKNPDLFWAIRGGGGGNFGYATEFTFHTEPVGALSLFKLQYSWASGRAAFDAWQQMIPAMPDELTTGFALLNNAVGTSDPGAMGAQVYGLFHGASADLSALIAPVLKAAGAPMLQTLQDTTFMEQAFYFGGCDSLEACQITPGGDVAGYDYYAKSSYANSVYSQQGIETVFSAVENWPGTSKNCMIESFAYGGAVNRVPSKSTAFPHRGQLFCNQYGVVFGPEDSPSTRKDAVSWLSSLDSQMSAFNTGEAYVNYIDGEQANWAKAYYAGNLSRLKRVKRKYDPDNVFDFAQAIPT